MGYCRINLFLNVIHKILVNSVAAGIHKGKRNAAGNSETDVHPWPILTVFPSLPTWALK